MQDNRPWFCRFRRLRAFQGGQHLQCALPDVSAELFCRSSEFHLGLQAIKNGIQLFPRVSMCVFKQNVLAGIQSHSVQCLLMTNVINEKVFILLYVWLALLFVISVLNLVHLLFNYVIRRNDMVDRYLQGRKGPLRFETFASWNLGFDGLLLLRFVENSAGFMMASTLAQALYDSLEKESIVDKNGFGGIDMNEDKELEGVRLGASKQLTDIQTPSAQKDLLNFSSAQKKDPRC